MTALKIARGALLLSGAVYLASMGLGSLSAGGTEFFFLLALLSAIGIALSAFACVLLQIASLLVKRPKHGK